VTLDIDAPDDRPSLPEGIRLRPATEADVPMCAAIWRDSLNDYMGRLNLPQIPDELGPIRRLHAHLHSTDPELFWVASRDGGEPVAFAAALRRDSVWFLSMLFVRPAEQGRGVGQALLRCVLPEDISVLGVGTDSAQPISNALYARHGMVPRMPLLSLVGNAVQPDALGVLAPGVEAVAFEEVAGGPPGGAGHASLVAAVDELDREVLGYAHPQEHRFLRLEGRRGFLYRDRERVMGYGYASAAGRVGPVAVRDEALLAPILGHLLVTVEPRGAVAVWAPGDAGATVSGLLRAGLRVDGFPVLLCWNRPFANFSRYLPISPGLL
jgi:GNAT superfamily N-acetyltransferase